MNRAVLEKLGKLQRVFYRDYWQHADKGGMRWTLAREMATYATLFGLIAGAACFFIPAALPFMATLGAAIMPSILAIRLYEINSEAKKATSLDITLPGIEDPQTATLTGTAQDLRIFANTQQLADRLTSPYERFVLPADITKKLAPYFNDCAGAAARLAVTCEGKPLESVPLTRPCFDWHDVTELPIYWRGELHSMLTLDGATKQKAVEELAARAAATITAVSQTQDGIAAPLTVKPIKLKVRA